MADTVQFNNPGGKKKGFWSRPEGVTGMLFLGALLLGGGYLVVTFLPAIMQAIATILGSLLYTIAAGAAIFLILFIFLNPRTRNLLWYSYKSVMRAITSMFVTLDPIGILKNYVSDLEKNLRKMSTQIGELRGQMRKLKVNVEQNNKEIDKNLKMASAAKERDMQQQMILSSRKAARLKESNEKYQALFNKMEVMHRILDKMYKNSEILLEDTKDQVKVKEQERKAIRASHSAMKSAMSVISGDPDKRAMFDQAMESITEDVATKVGEMERYMELSAKFMDSIDLQNGIFEEEGLQMLEKWEQESNFIFMDDTIRQTPSGLLDSGLEDNTLDLNSKPRTAEKQKQSKKSNNNYDTLFD